jgi:hypothetical protein
MPFWAKICHFGAKTGQICQNFSVFRQKDAFFRNKSVNFAIFAQKTHKKGYFNQFLTKPTFFYYSTTSKHHKKAKKTKKNQQKRNKTFIFPQKNRHFPTKKPQFPHKKPHITHKKPSFYI